MNKGTVILGALVGVGLGMLFAPNKGKATREKLKKEGQTVKDQITQDFKEVKEEVSKTAASGKAKFNAELKDVASKASYKTEHVISFLEKQLSVLKEKNKAFQHPS
jgi:gas vesicle protein